MLSKLGKIFLEDPLFQAIKKEDEKEKKKLKSEEKLN